MSRANRDDREQIIRAAYAENRHGAIAEAAKRLGFTRSYVSQLAKGYGLGKRTERFTDNDHAKITEWYESYVPVSQIAKAMGRSEGVISQHVLRLGLSRSGSVSCSLRSAPTFLKRILMEEGEEAFLKAEREWEETKRAGKQKAKEFNRSAHLHRVKTLCATANVDAMSRTDAMKFMYSIGMTLQEIGDKYGLTRERIRQIINDVRKP